MQHLIESGRILQVLEPQEGPNAGNLDGNWITVSGAQKAFIVINTAEGDNEDYDLTIRETDGTTPQDLQNTVPVWHNDDTGTNALMSRETNAVTHSVTGSTDNKITAFAVDLDRVSAGYDRISLRVTSAGDARNQDFGAVCYLLPARYKNPRS